MKIALTIMVAVIGSVLFYKLKIPAGALIGAIIFTAAFNIITGEAQFYSEIKFIIQALAGGFIGQRVTKSDVLELKKTLKGGVILFFCMIIYNLLTGFLLAAVTKLDLPTALMGCMPSGLTDSAIISSDLGADSTQTTAMQLVRTLFCLLILTQIGHKVCNKIDKNSQSDIEPKQQKLGYKSPETRTLKNFVITFVLALCMGVCGKLSGVPAGAMTFSVIAIAVLNVKTGKAYLPPKLKLVAQCVTGIIVGAKVSMADVQNMPNLIVPVLITLFTLIVCNYVCAFLVYKFCGLDIATCIFGSIPAGVSDMALIASDMGGDAPKVGVLQLVRFIGVLCVMPTIIKLIT